MSIKINKFCTTNLKKSKFNTSLCKQPRHERIGNKENINTDNLERIEFNVDTDSESLKVYKHKVQDGDYDESEVEEGLRFSKSKAKQRSSSFICKKTPRNSSHNRLKVRRATPVVGIERITDRRLSESNSFHKAQLPQRSFRTNFSVHASNGDKIRNGLSGCNIPRPQRFSFRSTESKSHIINSSNTTDKYSLLKNDYESLKDELADRNKTILRMQNEMREIKSQYTEERQGLIAKLEIAKSSRDYEVYQEKLDELLKENEQLSKKVQEREVENKQNSINKNYEIKNLNKEICALKSSLEDRKESKAYHSSKYKSEISKYQEKAANNEANLKNRLKLFELEMEQSQAKIENKIEQAVHKLKSKLQKKVTDLKAKKEKIHKLKLEIIEKDNKTIESENMHNQKYQDLIQNYLKEQEKSQRLQESQI
jgi:hypothetical protein